MINSYAYKAIKDFYGTRRANRSQVPLMNHIDEGLIILQALGATNNTKEAFCIHPLVQDDEMLSVFQPWPFDSTTLLYAMEYRSVANAYLAKVKMPEQGIRLSPLEEVNQMLIADKVQNRKDFLRYHQGHENFQRLDEYFKEWLDALGVSETLYEQLAWALDR